MKHQFDDLFEDVPKLSNSAKHNVVSRVKSNDSRKRRHVLPIVGTTVFIVACSIFLFTVINPSNSIFEFKNGNGQPLNEGDNVVINEEEDNLKEKENEIREQINKEIQQLNKKIQQMENEKKQEIESNNLRIKLLNDTEIIYRALEQLDFETIATMVHPQLGVTFALYADYGNPFAIGGENGGPYISFSREQLLENNDQIYMFGTHHASEEIIYEMSLNEYIQDILIYHYKELLPIREISYNEQLYYSGGIINTIHQFYPEAKFVEYYRYESDEPINDPISTQSLRFVYQDYEGEWYLTAIVRDVYSP